MKKKKSGLSNGVFLLLVIVLIARVALIKSRNSQRGGMSSWDQTYFTWSIFVLVFLIGYYFWSRSKRNTIEDQLIGSEESTDDTIAEKNLLENIYWQFDDRKFENLELFTESVIAYNSELEPDNNTDFHRIFNPYRKIEVEYLYWKEDEHGNEDQVEESFIVATSNREGFTVIEFLFLVHNTICENLKDHDHVFFEGLIDCSSESDLHPFFALRLGS